MEVLLSAGPTPSCLSMPVKDLGYLKLMPLLSFWFLAGIFEYMREICTYSVNPHPFHPKTATEKNMFLNAQYYKS